MAMIESWLYPQQAHARQPLCWQHQMTQHVRSLNILQM
jgi:hypothetical protein